VHPTVARVVDAAAAGGLQIDVRRFPEGTRTAADAARAVGCDVAQIVKSLVFVDGDRPVVALVSGANRVDLAKLARAAGTASVRRADGDEVRALTGFAIGGVPPFGHATPATVLVDQDLARHDTVWAAAGLPDAVFPVRPGDLVRISGGSVADLAEAAAAAG
jgi:Cys-tRNA(Pro) deacylase